MNPGPFQTPTLFQVTSIQSLLTPLHWGMKRSPEWRQALKAADAVLDGDPVVAQSAFATRTLGEPGYFFRYKTDPADFVRMISKKGGAIGPNFDLQNKDERNWLKKTPLVIAAHQPGEVQTVSTIIYLQVNALIPVAGHNEEFMVAEDLTGGSEAFRLVANFLWAGLSVHLEAPKKKTRKGIP